MTTGRHTPEPWAYLDCAHDRNANPGPDEDHDWRSVVAASDGEEEVMPGAGEGRTCKEALANADRITSCVNACAGINPEAVPDLFDALGNLLDRLAIYGTIDHVREEGPIEDAKDAITLATAE